MNLKELSDEEVLSFYRQWSEEYYAAGFIHPDEPTVKQFLHWLRQPENRELQPPTKDYEFEMLEIYWRLVHED